MAVFITNEGGILVVADVEPEKAQKIPSVVRMTPGAIEGLARRELKDLGLDDRIVIDRGKTELEFVFFKFLRTAGSEPFDYTPYYIERDQEKL